MAHCLGNVALGPEAQVALARALVNDPDILILDEPLGKLDSLTRITMQAELVSLWQREGFTAILVTQEACCCAGGGGALKSPAAAAACSRPRRPGALRACG